MSAELAKKQMEWNADSARMRARLGLLDMFWSGYYIGSINGIASACTQVEGYAELSALSVTLADEIHELLAKAREAA